MFGLLKFEIICSDDFGDFLLWICELPIMSFLIMNVNLDVNLSTKQIKTQTRKVSKCLLLIQSTYSFAYNCAISSFNILNKLIFYTQANKNWLPNRFLSRETVSLIIMR